MEQDFVAGLYRSMGMSVGAEFSTEDVSLLYHKVFHVPPDINEAHTAMKKIAGGDNSWSCAGDNIMDVLLEMERDREKKEVLYWNFQLLNAGNLSHMMDCLHQSTHSNTFKKAYDSDSGSLKPIELDGLQMGRLVRKKELCRRVIAVRRLKKAARQCWARLASEGVQSILLSPWQDQQLGIRGQAWGCVSLSDVLLLVEVKYDVVTHLLYTEMLQEHHTESVWETLPPWQQHKEVEGLEDLVEEALETLDMLCLAELPGAFRIYKAYLCASFRSCPESKEHSWSAVSLLKELHTFRQQERDTLTVLGERLHGESLRLLCLHIKLATLRAQREEMSYRALLAARQSWETWPQVNSPCRAEEVTLWLQGEDKEENFNTQQQQAMLQLLVLTQELERKHLVRLVHGVSLEDLQGPYCTKDSHKQAALRNGCIKKLRQIHAQMQTHNESPLEQTNPRPQFKSQAQVQAHGEWTQLELEDCAVLLLTHLVELQEVQASALLQSLMDKNVQRVQALRDKYESEIQAQNFTNLLHLLMSEAPLTSGSVLIPYPNLTENSSNEKIRAESCYTEKVQNASGESAEAQMADSIKRASSELNEVQTADESDRQDVYSGCGAVMEDLPYLEILCMSDAKRNAHKGLAAEGGAQEEDESGAAKSLQSYEKQGSLITLAWSRPQEDDTDCKAEAAGWGTGQNEDVWNSLTTQVQPTQCDETVQQGDGEELKPTQVQAGSASHHDVQSEDPQYSTVEQLTLMRRPIDDQSDEGGAAPESDLQAHALITESLQAAQPHLCADSSETEPHTDDLCSEASNDTVNYDSEVTEVEMCPAATESDLWDGRRPEPSHEDQKYSLEATTDCSLSERRAAREPTLTERERLRDPVSAMERERTMRNLVDMQRKVEQRQHRDRERQLMRVQERLSIIQNRKAEEDLLGLKHTDRLKQLTQDLPLEDKNQQKTVVRERLEQLRRERSYIMQFKRDRNTAGFKELLGPVATHSRETEDGAD